MEQDYKDQSLRDAVRDAMQDAMRDRNQIMQQMLQTMQAMMARMEVQNRGQPIRAEERAGIDGGRERGFENLEAPPIRREQQRHDVGLPSCVLRRVPFRPHSYILRYFAAGEEETPPQPPMAGWISSKLKVAETFLQQDLADGGSQEARGDGGTAKKPVGMGVRKGSGGAPKPGRRPNVVPEGEIVVKGPYQESPSSEVPPSRGSSDSRQGTPSPVESIRGGPQEEVSSLGRREEDSQLQDEKEEAVDGDGGKSGGIAEKAGPSMTVLRSSHTYDYSRIPSGRGDEPDSGSDLSSTSDSENESERREERRRRRQQMLAEKMKAIAAEAIKEREDTVARLEGEKQSLEKILVEREKRLESFLFANLDSHVEFGKEAGGGEEEVSRDGPLFFVDKSTSDDMAVYEEDFDSRIEVEREEGRKPAWLDDEEERTEVDIVKVNRLRKLRKEAGERVISGADYVARLRTQHAKLNPGTEWANIDRNSSRVGYSDDESDDESGVTVARGYEDMEGDDILRSNDDLVVKGGDKLLPGLLEYSRLMNANSEEPSNGSINSVQFHRNGQLLLTAGLDRRLRFFQVDGKRNAKIQSIFIEDCPIHKASFLPDGSEVIISGRRKFFYCFDLVKAAVSKIGPLTGREEKSLEVFEVSPDSSTIAFIGNEGYILLMSSRTKELIGTLKMNGSARSLAFAEGGQQLLSSGGDGQIYHWDLRTRRCIHKAVDEGCITGSAICVSPDSTLFAAGSSSGIVNVYKREEYLGGKRKPLKTIENLPASIGPCQVLEKFGDNAYRVELPDDVFISDVFNIRHLTPYAGENSSLRSSFSEEGVSDEDISSDQSPGQSNQSLDVPVPATQSQQATSGKPTPGSPRRSKRLQNKRA